MLQITVDLATADKSALIRTAEFILKFAGYPNLEPEMEVGATPAEEREFIESLQPDAPERLANVATPGPEVFGGNAASTVAAVGGEPSNPPAAPAAFAPATAPATAGLFPPPPPPAGIDVDARGLPWDPRIHASTRAKTAEGFWRQKRGTQPLDVSKVEAELRATMAVGAPTPAAPPVPPVPPVPTAGSVAPPAPPVSSTPIVPASAGAATTASLGNPTFPQLMGAITKGFTGGTLKKEQIDAAVSEAGLASLPMLASRPDLVGLVATKLGLAL